MIEHVRVVWSAYPHKHVLSEGWPLDGACEGVRLLTRPILTGALRTAVWGGPPS
jgi:hypothetical protein